MKILQILRYLHSCSYSNRTTYRSLHSWLLCYALAGEGVNNVSTNIGWNWQLTVLQVLVLIFIFHRPNHKTGLYGCIMNCTKNIISSNKLDYIFWYKPKYNLQKVYSNINLVLTIHLLNVRID